MYPKIDIYVGGEYFCSTVQSQTIKEALLKFKKNPVKVSMGKGGIETVMCPKGKVTAQISK